MSKRSKSKPLFLWFYYYHCYFLEETCTCRSQHDRLIHHGCLWKKRSRLGCVVSSQIGGVDALCVGSREVCHEFFGLGMLPEDAEVILLESVEFNRKHQLEWYVVLWACFKHGGAVQFHGFLVVQSEITVRVLWILNVPNFERSSWSFHLCIYDFKLDL